MDRDNLHQMFTLSRRICWLEALLSGSRICCITSVPAHVHFPAAFRLLVAVADMQDIGKTPLTACRCQQVSAMLRADISARSIGITPRLRRFADNHRTLRLPHPTHVRHCQRFDIQRVQPHH